MTDDIALCQCGIDLSKHESMPHEWKAAGTRHRCMQLLPNGFLCALPRYHLEDGIPHGPIEEKNWTPS